MAALCRGVRRIGMEEGQRPPTGTETSEDAVDAAGRRRIYTIGALASEFGLTARTIRFYEDEGLLSPKRDGQHRVYSYQDRGRLNLICRGKRLGFSLAEIKEFISLYDVDDCNLVSQMSFGLRLARDRIASLERQRQDVEQTLFELRQIEHDLVAHLHNVGGDPHAHDGERSVISQLNGKSQGPEQARTEE